MKVLVINGSPHEMGTTRIALDEMIKIFESEGVEVELFNLGKKSIHGCIGCGSCFKNKKCVFDDEVNQLARILEEADGVVIGSPVYYASPNGMLLSLLDRLFYSTRFDKRMKVGASVVAARRGGLTAAYDVLNKYFAISGMPIASGQYWNGIHGAFGEQAYEDKEGLQMMRTLAKNMVFLMRSIELGKEKLGLPEREPPQFTNFVR